MKITTTALLLLIATTTFYAKAALVKSLDKENQCQLFRVTTEEKPRLKTESLVIDKEIYGIGLSELEIDFENKIAAVLPTANVVMGLNRTFLNQKAIISSSNSNFNFFINQVNRKIILLETICITDQNELIYGSQFETETDKK
jgi:hypothetical protein